MERLHLFSIGFLYTIQNAALSFFTSPFLIALGLYEEAVGIVFAIASVLGIVFLALFPRLVRFFGPRTLFILCSTMLTGSLFGLMTEPPIAIALTLLLTCLLMSLLLWSVFDIGLEYITAKENETGRTRSLFLTVINIGFVAIPSIAGFLVTTEGFSFLFGLLGLSMLICTLYGAYTFPHVPQKPAQTVFLSQLFDILATQPHIRRVFSAQFMLQMFYAFMVVYMPIMLITTYDLSVQDMSIVFSIAMIAFLLVELPVGYMSDTWLGEKEIMIVGFCILVCTTAALPLLAGASVWAWAALMFATRVGAASIEITTESYFFKHVDSTNIVHVSAYRMLAALARIIMPLLGVCFLTFFPITVLPVALALCIGLVALIELPRLQDTR